ncbi:MAG: glycosyltransferase family 4 protein [Deltaproteobacteria bacterium]|nr:glycosyltransferase family 4 protein [Deltaproteobacteria bacterium]
MKKILILDTGKEWGGGTNSLIELLKRIDRGRFMFSALFYTNYKMGSGSNIKAELEKLGVEFILLERSEKRFYFKAAKEAIRPFLVLSPQLKKRFIFNLDYKSRIIPDSERIAKVLSHGGFDLLYMNNQPSSNLEGILAAKLLKLPCIQHSRVEVKLNSVEADAVNRWVSKVICVSKGVEDSLLASGVNQDRCTVVYNGIDSRVKAKRGPEEIRKELGVRKGSLLIGTVGSLVKRKRINLFIEAFAQLKRKDIFCAVVGEGPEMDNLKESCVRLGIKDRVIFTGFSADAISYINAFDLFVMPSEKEGLPRVILESMLMGKPVVAFDVVGTRELAVNDSTGILVKEENAEALASAIEAALGNTNKMRSMGEAGRKRVTESFGIERYIDGVSRVFEEVLS